MPTVATYHPQGLYTGRLKTSAQPAGPDWESDRQLRAMPEIEDNQINTVADIPA